MWRESTLQIWLSIKWKIGQPVEIKIELHHPRDSYSCWYSITFAFLPWYIRPSATVFWRFPAFCSIKSNWLTASKTTGWYRIPFSNLFEQKWILKSIVNYLLSTVDISHSIEQLSTIVKRTVSIWIIPDHFVDCLHCISRMLFIHWSTCLMNNTFANPIILISLIISSSMLCVPHLLLVNR